MPKKPEKPYFLKAEPYNWKIRAIGMLGSTPTESDTWQFYLAGDANINYAIPTRIGASHNRIYRNAHRGSDRNSMELLMPIVISTALRSM